MAAEIYVALCNQLSRFARLLDEKRWDEIDTVFAPDITFDYATGEECEGLQHLRANFTQYLEICEGSQHLIGSILMEGDEPPVTRCYVQARHIGRGANAGAIFDTNGEYTDRWRLDDGVWRIVRRDARFWIMSGDPAVIGFQP